MIRVSLSQSERLKSEYVSECAVQPALQNRLQIAILISGGVAGDTGKKMGHHLAQFNPPATPPPAFSGGFSVAWSRLLQYDAEHTETIEVLWNWVQVLSA